MPLSTRNRPQFRNIVREIKRQLDRHVRHAILVEAVYIDFQLSTIACNLLSPLLEGDLHMLPARIPTVSPETLLANPSDVLCPNAPALGVSVVFFSESRSQLIRALSYQIRGLWCPVAFSDSPGRDLLRCRWPHMPRFFVHFGDSSQPIVVAHFFTIHSSEGVMNPQPSVRHDEITCLRTLTSNGRLCAYDTSPRY